MGSSQTVVWGWQTDGVSERSHSIKQFGSVLMPDAALPRDEHGWPYQVIVEIDENGNETPHRDPEGRILGWVLDAAGSLLQGEDGPRKQVVPDEVAAAAEDWLLG